MDQEEFLENTKELIVKYMQLRKAQMSQRALEHATGVPRQVISQYEKGDVIPTVKAMNRILEPMGYKLDIVPICKECEGGDGKENEKDI